VALATTATALLLSGACAGAHAAPVDLGVIQLNVPDTTGEFVYAYLGTTQLTRRFHMEGKGSCRLAWDGPNNDLVTFEARRPGDSDLHPGMGATSIGVFDGAKGTPCSRVSAYASESLSFALGSALASRPATSPPQPLKVNAFYKLDLDVEVKSNAHVFLAIKLGGVTTRVYELRSGSSTNGVSPLYYPTDDSVPEMYRGLPYSNPLSRTYNCTSRSDSAPDSGPSDNCRWIVEDVGDSFTLSFVNKDGVAAGGGEFSLEGGGDWPDPVNHYSRIYLTHTESVDVGQLSCDGTDDPDNKTATGLSTTDPAAMCKVTRIGTQDGACDYLLGYRLATFTFDSVCSLDKTAWVDKDDPGAVLPAASNHKQVAGANQVTFTVEDRTVWDIEQTYMTFTKLDGSQTPPYYLSRCGGTVVQVDKGGNIVTTDPGETTILEVLEGTAPYSDPNVGLKGYMDGGRFVAGPPDLPYGTWDGTGNWPGLVRLHDFNDAVPNNGLIDWACILDNTETYVGDDEMYVTQHILFWGDAYFARN